MDNFNAETVGLVPFARSGRTLTPSEQTRRAHRLCLCPSCFRVKTHTKGPWRLNRIPITDENVFGGVCIRCRPSEVPREVLQAWELRNRPAPIVRLSPKPREHDDAILTGLLVANRSANDLPDATMTAPRRLVQSPAIPPEVPPSTDPVMMDEMGCTTRPSHTPSQSSSSSLPCDASQPQQIQSLSSDPSAPVQVDSEGLSTSSSSSSPEASPRPKLQRSVPETSSRSAEEEFELPVSPVGCETGQLLPGMVVAGDAARALANLRAAFPESVHAITQSLPASREMRVGDSRQEVLQMHLCSLLISVAAESSAARNTILRCGIRTVASAGLKDDAIEDSGGLRLAVVVLDLILLMTLNDCRGKRDGAQVVAGAPDNTVPTVVELLSDNTKTIAFGDLVSLSENPCFALFNVLLGSPSIFDLRGLVEFLQVVIQSSESNGVRDEACSVLWALTCRYQNLLDARVLSQLFQTIVELLIRYNGNDVPYRPEAHMLAAGGLCGASQCIRGTPIFVETQDVDHVVDAMYKVMVCDEQGGVDAMALFLTGILNMCYIYPDAMIESGVVVAVVDAMKENERADSIQEKGCAVLAVLVSSENLPVILSLAETEGIGTLAAALEGFPDNERIQATACKALSHMTIDPESRMLMSSLGASHCLVNAMKTHRDCRSLQESACTALLNITSDADDESLFESPELVNAIIDAMGRFPASARLQEDGLGIMQNISMKSAAAKRMIGTSGGIDSVLACIVEFMCTPSVLERAFGALCSLAVLEANQTRIAEANGIPLVINGMLASMEYERVQAQGCGCLSNLASDSTNNALIRDVGGGLDAIVLSMWAHYDSEVLQTEACRAISVLAVNVETEEVMAVTEVEINAILSGMRRFPQCGALQEYGCVALRNLMLSVDNVVAVVGVRGGTTTTATTTSTEKRLRQVVMQAASRFPDGCSHRVEQILASLE